MTMAIRDLSEEAIRAFLEAWQGPRKEAPRPVNLFNRPRREAGVLIPMTRFKDDWHLVFIRRTEHEHDHHGGQVAFPGGGIDPGDRTPARAALREAHEEIGLPPERVRILGELPRAHSVTNYVVTPIVGSFDWPVSFQPEPGEVARVFSIPLSWLADRGNHEIRYRSLSNRNPRPVIYFNHYDGELLWGFTARLTLNLLEALGLDG